MFRILIFIYILSSSSLLWATEAVSPEVGTLYDSSGNPVFFGGGQQVMNCDGYFKDPSQLGTQCTPNQYALFLAYLQTLPDFSARQEVAKKAEAAVIAKQKAAFIAKYKHPLCVFVEYKGYIPPCVKYVNEVVIQASKERGTILESQILLPKYFSGVVVKDYHPYKNGIRIKSKDNNSPFMRVTFMVLFTSTGTDVYTLYYGDVLKGDFTPYIDYLATVSGDMDLSDIGTFRYSSNADLD